MSKKKPTTDSLFCENDGGLGIEPCEGVSELALVDLTVSMEFSCLDRPTIHLCDTCAEKLRVHAEAMGYDVEID
jgi:hypothetical protein